MARKTSKSRVYKDSTAQQLRSFWETARLGSFAAAAEQLGLSNPTVWQQVRSLEQEFGEPLLEAHGRGCRLTPAGKILAEMVGPLVDDLATLRRRFEESRSRRQVRLVVTTTPRILVEDMPPCIQQYREAHPDVSLTLREKWIGDVHTQVETGDADIGIVMTRSSDMATSWKESDWLEYKPLYELKVVLITPRDHPLAKQRRIRVEDLAAYPLVNAPNSFPGLNAMAALEEAGLLGKQVQLVEAFFTHSMRRCVSMGLGIGLVESLATDPDPTLHERVMPPEFGRPVVYRLSLKGRPLPPHAAAFEEIVMANLAKAKSNSHDGT
ncbi:LysR family transcriptional regulator [Frigoriglobus tundricola]|uniref:Transcriptional regulator, LysR family n=1 Tax=Frigoriglobus tundricola TaxID=2774151 RepID=A0A6M5YGL6_9BACT|nr:LysR family transcriptional regulator [Frigoriglobus tundricola]QJW93138.1 Transcriptional regulator, LysR family [Frigoriglobus tundricola]